MRIQIIALICLFAFTAHAQTDKEKKDLFHNYDEVMKHHEVQLVEEVFTKNFLKEHGGKEEFITKVKSLPIEKRKKGLGKIFEKWKKSKVGKFLTAKRKDQGIETEFIIKEEDGKFKIDGTISDG